MVSKYLQIEEAGVRWASVLDKAMSVSALQLPKGNRLPHHLPAQYQKAVNDKWVSLRLATLGKPRVIASDMHHCVQSYRAIR